MVLGNKYIWAIILIILCFSCKRKVPYVDCSKCDSIFLDIRYKGFDYKSIKETQLIELDSFGREANVTDLYVDSYRGKLKDDSIINSVFIREPKILFKKNVKYKLRLKNYNDLVLNIKIIDFKMKHMNTMFQSRAGCILKSYTIDGLLIEDGETCIEIDKNIVDSLVSRDL